MTLCLPTIQKTVLIEPADDCILADAGQMNQVEKGSIDSPNDDTKATAHDAGPGGGGAAIEVTVGEERQFISEKPGQTDPDTDGDVVGKVGMDEMNDVDVDGVSPDEGDDNKHTYAEEESNEERSHYQVGGVMKFNDFGNFTA